MISEKWDAIKNKIENLSVEEILKEDLLNFFNISTESFSIAELESLYDKQIFNELGQPLAYFRKSIEDIKNHFFKYEWLHDHIFTDSKSQFVFENIIFAKVNMSIEGISLACTDSEIYFDKEIWGNLSEEVFIDCGGYTGDTALQFIKSCPNYKQIYVYEAYPPIYKKCSENLSYFIEEGALIVKNCAVSNTSGLFAFSINQGTGDGCIDVNGETEVAAISLDEDIHERVSFIKMDIEGAEKNALKGAKKIIEMYAPKMAICIYHLPDDFWRITELILEINKNYTFQIRQHTHSGFSETVLYCIPIEKKSKSTTIAFTDVSSKRLIKSIENLVIRTKEEINYLTACEKDRNWYLFQLRMHSNQLENANHKIDKLNQTIYKMKKENKKKIRQIARRHSNKWNRKKS